MTPIEHLGLAVGLVFLIVWWIFHDAWHEEDNKDEDEIQK